MDGVGTSIVGRSRRLSADRRARPTYILIWEEPDSLAWTSVVAARGAVDQQGYVDDLLETGDEFADMA